MVVNGGATVFGSEVVAEYYYVIDRGFVKRSPDIFLKILLRSESFLTMSNLLKDIYPTYRRECHSKVVFSSPDVAVGQDKGFSFNMKDAVYSAVFWC